MRLEYRHLEVLIAVDDAGSLTAAAKLLGTNQPHVSRQLRRIEEHLGLPVFQRTADGVRPTSAGMQVLARARRALSAAQQFGGPPEQGKALRILHERLDVAALLRRLLDVHPEVEPELAVAAARQAVPRLLGGEADVYLGVRLPHVVWPQVGDLVVQRVVSDPLHVLMPADHRAAGDERIELEELAREDWIVTATTDARDMTLGECRAVGGFEPRLRYQVHDSEHVRALVRDGLGVAFVSSTWTSETDTVSRPYLGAGFAHWSVISAPGRVAPAVTATLVELVRRPFDPTSVESGSRTSPGYA